MEAQIHLTRKSIKGYGKGFHTQRMTYDLSQQTPESIHEFKNVMREFAARSNGEFEYAFSGDVNWSCKDQEFKDRVKECEKIYKQSFDETD